jgi:DNA replication protein DnaC
MRELKNIKLLILDDWGLNVFDHNEGRDLLEVIEERTQSNSTVILSQLCTEDWHGLFIDPIVGDAVLDRLINGSYQINLVSKESMRSFNFQRT